MEGFDADSGTSGTDSSESEGAESGTNEPEPMEQGVTVLDTLPEGMCCCCCVVVIVVVYFN